MKLSRVTARARLNRVALSFQYPACTRVSPASTISTTVSPARSACLPYRTLPARSAMPQARAMKIPTRGM